MPGVRAFAVGDDRDGIASLDQVTDSFGVIGLACPREGGGDEETFGRQARNRAGGPTVVFLAGAEVTADRQTRIVRPNARRLSNPRTRNNERSFAASM